LKYFKINNLIIIISFFIILILGCTAPSLKSKIEIEDEIITGEGEIDEVAVKMDSPYVYQDEEPILEEILKNYEEAVVARQEGNFGLAEMKIEDSFVLSIQVDTNEIKNEFISSRFKEILALLGQEYGIILSESAKIAEEDPMAWLDEIDADKFKSGQWTDDELKNIVMKIATKSDIPIEFNQRVRNAIYYFQNGGKEDMTKWLKRSGRYLPMIQEILGEEGIPRDMVYLSMIESGFSPKAYSRARAVGLWQFIYSTGKIYGLNRNQWIDERRDPVKATKAAAKHLNDLYKISDDWNIVMAAYNSGQNRVVRQLKNVENLEFWDMQLPRETRNYVPSFMAAVVISKEPEIFGFDNIEKDPPFEFDTVEVHPYTSLQTAAKCAGTGIEEIRDLNPEILQNRVPPGEEMYTLRIPKNTENMFLAEYTKIPIEKYETPKVSSVIVRRGDTFSGIARRYGISISRLHAANPQIRNIHKLRIGQRINIPGKTTILTSPINVSRENTFEYTVRKNDTLGILAESYHTNVQTLQALNNMGRRTTIYVGKKLLIPGGQNSKNQKQQRITDLGNAKIIYIVQKNDTIYEIAQKYGVDYRKIIEINKIRNYRKIMPGQKLIIKK